MTFHVAAPAAVPAVQWGLQRLSDALALRNITLQRAADGSPAQLRISIDPSSASGAEGYQLQRSSDRWALTGGGAAGAMYGLLDLAEQVRMRGVEGIEPREARPHLPFRALKFNLPWSSYRGGRVMTLHTDACRDPRMWIDLLDMMAENRFNALTLWNLHPFPWMIRPEGFPEANIMSEAESADWRAMWTTIFREAKDRGIESWIVFWSIFTSDAFAAAHGISLAGREYYIGPGDTSELVKRYNRQCIRQVIDEYPDLAGIGVSLGERMENLTPQQRSDWIEEVVIAGMKEASRPVKFIHRAPFTADPMHVRRVISRANLPGDVLVEYKFNWSHGHSTPRLSITHDVGPRPPGAKPTIDTRYWDPPPQDYRMAWMVRNEDVFVLRWGEPGFIREHIRLNTHPWVAGCFVGSEGMIPAREYAHRDAPCRTWNWGFQRQWLFYRLWGRLMYDPATADEVLAEGFSMRYGADVAGRMLDAFALASRMPLRLASFFGCTWDYTLYAEGFLAPFPSLGLHEKDSPFISVNELIDHRTLAAAYVSIIDFVAAEARGEALPDGILTPLELADRSDVDGRAVLKAVGDLRAMAKEKPPTHACELADLEAWAHLSLYLADKLRGAVALQRHRTTPDPAQQAEAIEHLERAAGHWEQVCRITDGHYQRVPYIERPDYVLDFAWSDFRDRVQHDIAIALEG